MTCPFCSTPLQLLKDGSAGQSCPGCRAAWLDSGRLVNVVGRPALAQLVENAASDGTQRCSACHKPYRGKECPRCGGPPVTCPGCGGTLSTFTCLEVALDVCPPCQGVLFDPGELRELRTRVARIPAPAPEREVLSHFECERCDKRVKWQQGFEDGGKYYCGSCAPAGCTPLDTTLSTEATYARERREGPRLSFGAPGLLGVAANLAWNLFVEDD
ncbi:MAG: hypothetical protein RL653_967 [Pseudomonadota bacterium]|jgi:Zn-finger nucleic acid-binding protein